MLFYYSLADEAMKNNDHNTVLIRAALDNTAIRRLKIEETKKMKRVKDKFEIFMVLF